MIVSFAWTTAALLAGAKTVTRRDEWTATHAEHFRPGQDVDAWDRLPRVKGAKKIAVVRVARAPYRQRSSEIPPDAWHAEGFAWMQAYRHPPPRGGPRPMKLGPFVIVPAATYRTWQTLALEHIRECRGPVVDLGGVKIARQLIPHILHEADGALVLTRHGKRLRLARPRVDEFVVTEVRE